MAEIILIVLLVAVGIAAAWVALFNFWVAADAHQFGVGGVLSPWPAIVALVCFGGAAWFIFT